MKLYSLFFATTILLNPPALADLTQGDLDTFSGMREEMMSSGNFKLLEKSTLTGDIEFTPFQQRIHDIKTTLIDAGLSSKMAEEQSIQQFHKEMEQNGSSLAIKKSQFRSGEIRVALPNGKTKTLGNDFCHQITGECLSQQNPKLMGKRPSRGQISYFFPGEFKENLADLKVSAKILGQNQPWSDDYWAIQRGVLGHRYADKNARQPTWKESLQYVLKGKNHLLEILDRPDGPDRDLAIARLSPGEKYDLLIGRIDESDYDSWFLYLESPEYSLGMPLFGMVGGFLTPNHWGQGQAYYDEDGEVETWMGICHGWASAASHLPRPRQVVTALAFDGETQITFYPADIKALGSLLWAESAPRSRFIGGRCNDKEVEKDPTSGAILNEDCFDTNPADWHLVATNYLGEMQQSFIMDATFDYAVWNQPVLAYDIIFFNPITGEQAQDFSDVKIDWLNFAAIDPFKNIREDDLRRRYLVGVFMKVEYLAETRPTQKRTDDFQSDKTIQAFYAYDLELDENFKIIGGEWYQDKHPDFLWVHDQEQKAISRFEQYYAANIEELLIENYEKGLLSFDRPVQPELTEYAKAAAVRGQVAAFIVEALFSEAQ